MARLIVIDGPSVGAEYEITAPDGGSTGEIVLGRDPGVGISLNDRAISREHCKIEVRPSGSRLIDLGSRNKTYLNNDPIETCRLKNGDRLLIGDTELRFEDDSPEVEGNSLLIHHPERGGGGRRRREKGRPPNGRPPAARR